MGLLNVLSRKESTRMKWNKVALNSYTRGLYNKGSVGYKRIENKLDIVKDEVMKEWADLYIKNLEFLGECIDTYGIDDKMVTWVYEVKKAKKLKKAEKVEVSKIVEEVKKETKSKSKRTEEVQEVKAKKAGKKK